MSIVQLQQEFFASLRTLVHLSPKDFKFPEYRRPDQFGHYRDDRDKLEDMLQWIALILMNGPRTNVAVAVNFNDKASTSTPLVRLSLAS